MLTFNENIAYYCDERSAVIYEYIKSVILVNKETGNKHFYKAGKYWAMLSIREIVDNFMLGKKELYTQREVRISIKKLLVKGYLIKGEYGRHLWYRACWYSLGKKTN